MDVKINKLESTVNESTEDMIMERKATLAKYSKQFDQIKLVCCKYFEKYDIELEAVKIKAKNVMEKYQDWSKVLIEPTSLNDARLFSLESRIHEEEEIRIKEYDFLKDMTKKLIYSLEQLNLNAVDVKGSIDDFSKAKGSPTANKTKSQTPLLPNLLNN